MMWGTDDDISEIVTYTAWEMWSSLDTSSTSTKAERKDNIQPQIGV